MNQDIHDMIQTFDMGGHPELVTSRLLDILDAMNRRIDQIGQGCVVKGCQSAKFYGDLCPKHFEALKPTFGVPIPEP